MIYFKNMQEFTLICMYKMKKMNISIAVTISY